MGWKHFTRHGGRVKEAYMVGEYTELVAMVGGVAHRLGTISQGAVLFERSANIHHSTGTPKRGDVAIVPREACEFRGVMKEIHRENLKLLMDGNINTVQDYIYAGAGVIPTYFQLWGRRPNAMGTQTDAVSFCLFKCRSVDGIQIGSADEVNGTRIRIQGIDDSKGEHGGNPSQPYGWIRPGIVGLPVVPPVEPINSWDAWWRFPSGSIVWPNGPHLGLEESSKSDFDLSSTSFSIVYFVNCEDLSNRYNCLFEQREGATPEEFGHHYTQRNLPPRPYGAMHDNVWFDSVQHVNNAPFPQWDSPPVSAFVQRNCTFAIAHEYIGAGTNNNVRMIYNDGVNKRYQSWSNKRHPFFHAACIPRIAGFRGVATGYFSGRIYAIAFIKNYLVTQADIDGYYAETIDPSTYQNPFCYIKFNMAVPAVGATVQSQVGGHNWTVYGNTQKPVLNG